MQENNQTSIGRGKNFFHLNGFTLWPIPYSHQNKDMHIRFCILLKLKFVYNNLNSMRTNITHLNSCYTFYLYMSD